MAANLCADTRLNTNMEQGIPETRRLAKLYHGQIPGTHSRVQLFYEHIYNQALLWPSSIT